MRKGDVDTILPGTRSDSAQAKTIVFGGRSRRPPGKRSGAGRSTITAAVFRRAGSPGDGSRKQRHRLTASLLLLRNAEEQKLRRRFW